MSSLKYEEDLSTVGVYVSKFLIGPSDKLVIDYALEASGIDENENSDQSDISARELFWRMLFEDAPMPTPKLGTAERASGILGRDIDLTDEAMEIGIAQLDQ